MKILIVDDEFTSRKLLQVILNEYGELDLVVNGKEAVDAFKMALDENKPYDIIFLDIMMPEKDGQTVLSEIRNYEEENGIFGMDSVKIVMTTALSDADNITNAFVNQCEAYLVKPITKDKVIETMKKLELI